jgi:hypothetical protein
MPFLDFDNKHCFYCGAIFNITGHHLKVNGMRTSLKIRLCRNCHDDLDFKHDPKIFEHIKKLITISFLPPYG